ncbi:hypothetical protein PGTUg99_019086 [Puccinia graminis f. sp. tritici]|uniref:Uncharacterized protein n=1 Tax=Puccinia graminis f. sp. tritici TaxID=56615 RepID=A0A5B0R7C2_PUCGR|nr:hypothetical protein PGTUg99_019086 [Puccinia graminis f. sp. tritici]
MMLLTHRFSLPLPHLVLLVCLFKLSGTSLPIGIHAGSKVQTISPSEHSSSECNLNLIKDINASEIQPNGKRRKTTPSDSSDKTGLTDFYNFDPEGLEGEWWETIMTEFPAINGLEHGAVTPITIDNADPSEFEANNVQYAPPDKMDAQRQTQRMKEPQDITNQQGVSGTHPEMLSHGNRRHELPKPKPTYNVGNEELEIIRFSSTQKSKSLYGLANKALTTYGAKSETLYKIKKNFERKVEQYRFKQDAKCYYSIYLSGVLIDLIPDFQEYHSSAIDPIVMRNQEGLELESPQGWEGIKNVIARIIEALQYFNELASLNEIDVKLLHVQLVNTHGDLMEWFWDILFKRTDNYLPLSVPTGSEANELHRSINKVMHSVILDCKDAQNHQVYDVALSLLQIWYKASGLALEKPDYQDHLDNYWDLMAELGETKIQFKKVQHTSVFSNHNDDDGFATKVEGENSFNWTQLFTLISVHRKKIPRAGNIEEIWKLVHMGIPSIWNLAEAEKKNRLMDLPIYMIPLVQGRFTSKNKEVAIGLIMRKDLKRKRAHKIDIFSRRINQILIPLAILPSIISLDELDEQILGGKTGITPQDLIQWFQSILFDNTVNSLPLFGIIEMPSIPNQPPEKLFTSAQRYLSKQLTSSGIFTQDFCSKTALTLLGYFYEERALERGVPIPNDDHPDYHLKIMNKLLCSHITSKINVPRQVTHEIYYPTP